MFKDDDDDEDGKVPVLLPLEWVERVGNAECGDRVVMEACRRALADRKSVFDRWREDIQDPAAFDMLEEKFWGRDMARVMSAAPKLVDCLLNVIEQALEMDGISEDQWSEIEETFYEAMPEDVAAELIFKLKDSYYV